MDKKGGKLLRDGEKFHRQESALFGSEIVRKRDVNKNLIKLYVIEFPIL